MKTLKSFLNFIIECNLYIAGAAVVYTIQAQIQLGMKPQWHPYLFLIFFATLFEYNSSRFITVVTKKGSLGWKKNEWVKNHLRLFYSIVLISVTGFLFTCFAAKREVLAALLPLGLLTLFYSFPLYKIGAKLFRLRDVPFLKIFMIFFNDFIAERFFFIFAITIPFDIRDMESDRKAGTKTLPLHIGEKYAWIVSGVFLAVFIFLSYLNNEKEVFIALALSSVVTLACFNNKKLRDHSYYYYVILDGMIILQAGLVWAGYYMK